MGEGEESGVGFYHGERRRRDTGRLGRGASGVGLGCGALAAARLGKGEGRGRRGRVVPAWQGEKGRGRDPWRRRLGEQGGRDGLLMGPSGPRLGLGF
jgi:hypothetical protein